MLSEAYRGQVDYSVREDSSVCLSSSSMSDRTGQPVGDGPGRPGEHGSSEAQIRTLFDDQKELILAECQARIIQHEFQAARAEEVPGQPDRERMVDHSRKSGVTFNMIAHSNNQIDKMVDRSGQPDERNSSNAQI